MHDRLGEHNAVVCMFAYRRPLAATTVDVRCLNQSAEAGELSVADVVEHDEQHVRRSFAGPLWSGPGRLRLLDRPPGHAWERVTGCVLRD